MFSLRELLDELYSIEFVLESLEDAKKIYNNGLVDVVSERNRVYHDAIHNIEKSIEMIHEYNPGIDAISNILCAISNWNYSDINFMEGYFRKRKVLGDALNATYHGILDMYNRHDYYLRSFIGILKDYTNHIEDFEKVVYDDSNDMTMIKNFNDVDELDMEKAQHVSKILSITNRLYKYYDESLKMLS